MPEATENAESYFGFLWRLSKLIRTAVKNKEIKTSYCEDSVPMQNPECLKCGLLKSTIDATRHACIANKCLGTVLGGVHDFGDGNLNIPIKTLETGKSREISLSEMKVRLPKYIESTYPKNPNADKIILHLCADIGSDSKPYKDAGYDVRLIGSQIGVENYHPILA